MSDTDKMPFGKYRGTPLQDVPASYLHWWYHECNYPHNQLKEYIEQSWSALQQETPDLIWTKRK